MPHISGDVFLVIGLVVALVGIIVLRTWAQRINKARAQEVQAQDETQEADSSQLKVTAVSDLEKEISGFDISTAPKSTTLSANEVYLLEKAGYSFCQVVMGNVVYSMGLRGLFRSVNRAFRRGEMVDFTRMINDARLVAHRRMLKQAADLKATDVLDVNFETHEYADFLEVTVMGAAVVRIGPAQEIPVAASAS